MRFFWRTEAQRRATEQAKAVRNASLEIPHAWFAWHPVPFNRGGWVWLEKVVRTKLNDDFFYEPIEDLEKEQRAYVKRQTR